MEYMFRTHKEPAWGWIGALIEGRRRAATSRPNTTELSAPASMLGRRAAC
jgi:hypothetical protein